MVIFQFRLNRANGGCRKGLLRRDIKIHENYARPKLLRRHAMCRFLCCALKIKIHDAVH